MDDRFVGKWIGGLIGEWVGLLADRFVRGWVGVGARHLPLTHHP